MKKIYLAHVELPEEAEESGITFYEDKQVVIYALVTWDSNLKIEKIKFTPISKHVDDNFQIVDINPCKLEDSNKEFFMVHIWREKNAINRKDYTASASNDLKGIELLKEFDTELFLFSIHETDNMPVIDNEQECKFTDTTPESKGGAIIIGI